MGVLLEHGANINAMAKDGSTALLIASLFGQVDAIRVLVARGACIDLPDSSGKTPLMVASENKHSQVVNVLLDAGADVALRSANCNTALLFAASGGDASCVEVLLDKGADANDTDKSMRSCLHLAAMGGHLDVAMVLLSKGADINFQDNIGDSPLHATVLQGHLNGVSLLLEHEAHVDMQNSIGWSPLMLAAQRGNVEIAAILAEKGAKVDAATHDERTALHLAAEEGHVEVVRKLLECGAEVNVSDSESWTPLMRAAHRGHEHICRLLLDNNGDLGMTNKLDRTALDVAYLNHRYEIVETLKEFMDERQISPTVSTASRDAKPKSPEWFIPSREVRRDPLFFSRGAFGKVYRGWWLSTRVVVKTVTVATEKESRTFQREARIWQKARHPNIVPFFGACDEGSQYFFVCEEAKNGKLLDYLAQERKEGRSVLWSKLLDAALGLHFLHERHIVHSDLKCNQILVSKDGVAKLTDFGLSFLTTEPSGDEETVGAIRWKAPEVIRTVKPVAPNAQSDVYSFGMCVVEAVTRDVPWGQIPDSVVKYHVTRVEFQQRPREFVNGAHWELVQGLCAHDPSKRTKLCDAIDKLRTFAAAEKPQGKRLVCSAFA
jgi:ankyrin repeat protein